MINWKDIYNHLIEKNKHIDLIEGIYYERHHIVPRYMGINNSNENLVYLSFREHILAHYILWRLHGNVEDKIAYKMMSGQTVEGRTLKQELAIRRSNESNKIEILRELYKDEEYKNNVVNKRKTTLLKNNPRNDGYYYTFETRELLKLRFQENYDAIINPESIKKRAESYKQTIANMTDDEFNNRFVKPMEGPLHPMYGKKRPGELAGNYGKSKGKYILVTPEGEQIYFSGIRKLMDFGFSEALARKWANNGTIQKSPNIKRPFKWGGYELQFILNEVYGDINKHQENRKRFN